MVSRYLWWYRWKHTDWLSIVGSWLWTQVMVMGVIGLSKLKNTCAKPAGGAIPGKKCPPEACTSFDAAMLQVEQCYTTIYWSIDSLQRNYYLGYHTMIRHTIDMYYILKKVVLRVRVSTVTVLYYRDYIPQQQSVVLFNTVVFCSRCVWLLLKKHI